MARRGRKRRLGLEDEYWKLIAEGVGTMTACKQLGIGRKTGYRWRAETGGLAPQRDSEQMHSSRYLSLLDRQRIASLRARGLGVRQIAVLVGRSASTVSRELRRGTAAHDRGGYDGDLAHARAQQRRTRIRPGRLATDTELCGLVQDKLRLEWSPEQIAAWLAHTYPERVAWHVCHETIYQALYTGRSGLSRTLTARLRTGRALRQRRRRALERTPRYVIASRLIDARPAVVETRSRCGDWEGDLIVGTASRSAIGTVVDRKSRYIHLVHLPDGHTAADLAVGLRATMSPLAANLRFTLTWDQGSEMAAHDRISDLFDEGVFFAHAGKPWQRGSNENTNGLLRQYFPKGTDLRIHSAATLQAVAQRLNNRPRKTLGWRTPADVFQAGVTSHS
jgi:IS30 family transposase